MYINIYAVRLLAYTSTLYMCHMGLWPSDLHNYKGYQQLNSTQCTSLYKYSTSVISRLSFPNLDKLYEVLTYRWMSDKFGIVSRNGCLTMWFKTILKTCEHWIQIASSKYGFGSSSTVAFQWDL